MLRWNRFVQGDNDAYMANVKKFTEKTGIEVRVDNEGWEDVRPKAAVAANTGAGPGHHPVAPTTTRTSIPTSWSTSTDVANYLGKKYGGWYPVVRGVSCARTARSGSACRWAAPAA